MVHHYTTEHHHLPLILTSGSLRPNNAGAEHEPPLVWFSKEQRWEGTSTKMVMGADGPRLLTFAEQLAEFGCARFSLSADDARLMSWVRNFHSGDEGSRPAEEFHLYKTRAGSSGMHSVCLAKRIVGGRSL